LLAEMEVAQDNKLIQSQVDRILRSEDLRGSDVLRRLLKFLAEKSISGEADELKEYIVAIDGLGKPSTYDPSHNSTVRIQVGRLRQKLADYYRGEGREDPIVIDVPKGRFKLRFEYRTSPIPAPSPVKETPGAPHQAEAEASERVRKKSFRDAIVRLRFAIPVWVGVTVALAIGEHYWFKSSNASAASIPNPQVWDADMQDLWRPFIETKRPLILAIEDPLFAEMNGSTETYFRDRTLNNWNDIASSHTVETLRTVLKAPAIQPSRHYTSFGEVDASFMIAKLLGPREQNISVVKTSDLSLRQMNDSNVIFVGVENLFFQEKTQAMPIEAELQPVREGIRNVHPGQGEPALFADQYSTAPLEEGFAYALVTHLPGPLRDSDVESFSSSRSTGYVGAVKFFTDPSSVHSLAAELRKICGGRMPRYYQVLLKVKFEKEVPTAITFVLARELH
jgi:hypothetical protein